MSEATLKQKLISVFTNQYAWSRMYAGAYTSDQRQKDSKWVEEGYIEVRVAGECSIKLVLGVDMLDADPQFGMARTIWEAGLPKPSNAIRTLGERFLRLIFRRASEVGTDEGAGWTALGFTTLPLLCDMTATYLAGVFVATAGWYADRLATQLKKLIGKAYHDTMRLQLFMVVLDAMHYTPLPDSQDAFSTAARTLPGTNPALATLMDRWARVGGFNGLNTRPRFELGEAGIGNSYTQRLLLDIIPEAIKQGRALGSLVARPQVRWEPTRNSLLWVSSHKGGNINSKTYASFIEA